MEMERSEIFKDLARSVIDMDVELAKDKAKRSIDLGISPYDAITLGLAKGMEKVNELYETEEYFVPELLICADAMYAGMEVLRPHMPREGRSRKKAVIGVIKGDTHDIGKNLVKIMLDNAGFEIHDLGRDVSYSRFVDTAGETGADLVCLSTLMTTTMDGMQVVIEDLRKARLTSKVMVGGGPISPGFARTIGADGYAKNAAEAVKVARSIIQGIPFSALRFKDNRELAGIERGAQGGQR